MHAKYERVRWLHVDGILLLVDRSRTCILFSTGVILFHSGISFLGGVSATATQHRLGPQLMRVLRDGRDV